MYLAIVSSAIGVLSSVFFLITVREEPLTKSCT